jgi:arginyl-tRNA synthetase
LPPVPDAALIAPIRETLAAAARDLVGDDAPPVELAAPANPEHGDLATPIAMALARPARRAPREIAESLADALREGGLVEGAEVAGPGFLNLTLAPAWFADAAAAVVDAGEAYGAGQADPPQDVHLEFISANPTGPLHVGHARHAAYGDALARILAFAGHTVHREFYVNDYGRQMELFGASVAARYGELLGVDVPFPEDGYRGDYVTEIAAKLRDEVGDAYRDSLRPLSPDALAFFALRGKDLMFEGIVADLERFRVRFDDFFSETSLHVDGRVADAVERLVEAGDAYEHEGAIWFATTRYGDEKDRVLRRADGTTTYIAPDVAYHLDKAARGYDVLINVLGADHHGYVERLRAVLSAGGHEPGKLEVPLIQLVSLVEAGEARRMSKRAGTLVPLADLLDDVGVDAARFFLVQRAHETSFDLDLDLARRQQRENPVYYAQYVHARATNILERVTDEPPRRPPPSLEPPERALALRLVDWPDVIREAEVRRAPHRVAVYLIDLALDFHVFYERCRVADAPDDVRPFRLDLVRGVRSVTGLALGLLGVEAPDRM